MSHSVIIRRCASLEEAAVINSILQAFGFQSVLGNWHHSHLNWEVMLALGGIDVRVPYSEADDATNFLEERLINAQKCLKQEFPDLDTEPLYRSRWRIWLLLAYYATPIFGILMTYTIYMQIKESRQTRKKS